MYLITYATHDSGYFKALKISAQRNGYELVILGYGDKWEGFTKRFLTMKDFIKEVDATDENKICCFIDAFDIIMLGPSTELESKYKQMNTNKVVFSASNDNFMNKLIFGDLHEKDKDEYYNKINAGCYIGYAKSLLILFENLCDRMTCKPTANDQALINKYYLQNDKLLMLDTKSELFYNVEQDTTIIQSYTNIIFDIQNPAELQSTKYRFEQGRIILPNGSKPLLLHGNGNTNLDNFCKSLDLPLAVKENRNYFLYSTSSFFKDLFYNIFLYSVGLLVLVGPYIYSKNKTILYILLFVYAFIVVQWKFATESIAQELEDKLLSDKAYKYAPIKDTIFKSIIPVNTIVILYMLSMTTTSKKNRGKK
jgi:hypothetical protein